MRRQALAPARREGRDAAGWRFREAFADGARHLRADGDGDRARPGARPRLASASRRGSQRAPRDRRDPALRRPLPARRRRRAADAAEGERLIRAPRRRSPSVERSAAAISSAPCFSHSNFLGIPPEDSTLEKSRVVDPAGALRAHRLLRRRHARTARRAILEASHYVELYDDELDEEVYRIGVHTLPAWLPDDMEPAACVAGLEKVVAGLLAPDRFVLTLGGEHSIAPGPIRAHHAQAPEDVGPPLRRPRRPARRVRGTEELARLRRAPLGRARHPVGPRRHPLDLEGGDRLRPQERDDDRLQPRDAPLRRLDGEGAGASSRARSTSPSTWTSSTARSCPRTGTPEPGGGTYDQALVDPAARGLGAADHRRRRGRARPAARATGPPTS